MNELTIIDKSIDVFRGGAGILLTHQDRSAKALVVCESILNQWQVANSISDPAMKAAALAEVDGRSNKFLANCGVANKEMKESRKAITQLMDTIKAMFTEEENKLDVTKGGRPAEIQRQRNTYVSWLAAERTRVEKEAADRANKSKEEAEIRSHITSYISKKLLGFLSDRKEKTYAAFNGITLENFAEKKDKLQKMDCTFPVKQLDFQFGRDYANDTTFCIYHDTAEKEAIWNAVHQVYNWDEFYVDYNLQILALKQELIDKLPSKKEELEEAARYRLHVIAEQKEREERMAAEKNAKAKKLLAEENERKNREAAEALERAAKEKADREEADRIRLEKEKQDQLNAAQEKEELAKQAEQAAALFNQSEEISSLNAAPDARSGYSITVLHKAGWVELVTFWYQREGVDGKTSLDDFDKKTFKQIKTFAEKMAKAGEKIESKYLKYETEHKAVNKREKVSAAVK